MNLKTRELLLRSENTAPFYIGTPLLRALGLCAAITGLGLSSLHAASATWTGGAGGTETNMSVASNWSSGSATFASGDVMTFDSTTALGTLTWSANLGPSFGATDGVHINYTGSGNLTLDGVAGTSGLQLGLGNITIASGAGAFSFGTGADSTILVYRGASNTQTYTNNSSNVATFASDILWRAGGGAAKTVNLDGTGDWLFNAPFRIDATQGQTNVTVVKNGSGTVSFAAANNLPTTPTLTINQGAVAVVGTGLLGLNGTHSGAINNNATFAYQSSSSQTISGVVSGSGALIQSAGTLTLTADNSYTGATTVAGGALKLGGAAGAINSTSSIVVNGAGAKFTQNSDVAVSPTVTLQQGAVDGTKTISSVTVTDNVANTLTHGDGTAASLTIGSLGFQGDANITVSTVGDGAAAPIIVTGALTTTPAAGTLANNATQPFWNSGTRYRVVDFGSTTGSASHFSVGSVGGLTSRQSAVVDVDSTSVALLIQGDTPRWTGANGGVWSTSSTGNWVLAIAGTPTTFINGDLARFDDNATGTTITIPSPGVSPSLALFENNTTSFTLAGDSGITGTGSVTKNGTGTVTIGTINSYTGGTLINSGTLALTGSGTLGGASAAVTVAGGTLDLGATSTTIGTVTVSGPGTIQNGTLSAASLVGTNTSGNASVSAVLGGSGTVAMNGAGGTLTLSGANSYTGGTTVNAGTLALSGSGTLGGASASVNVAGGVLDLGATSQILGDVTLSSASGTIQNGTLATTTLTGTNTAGTAVVAADLIGTGGVTKTGAGGILALSGTNLYTGATQVNSGTLQLGNAGTTGSISAASPINLASGATFAINRTNATVQGVDFGVITGTGGLVAVSGTGNTTFNAANTYTGTTRITSGRLYVTHSEAVGTGLLNVDGFGARLQLQDNVSLANAVQIGGGTVVQSLTGNNVLNGNLTFGNFGATTTTLSTGAGSLTLNGTVTATLGGTRTFVLQGQGLTIVNGPVVNGTAADSNVAITKNETGTLILRGANTYPGQTNVNGGIFRVEGSLAPHPTSGTASNVEVNEAGTLAGTGVISGNVNIYGTLRPGAGGSAGGVLQFNSNSVSIDFFSGSTQFDIVGALVTGVRTTVPGSFSYSGPLRLNFTGGVYNGSYQLFDIAGGAGGSLASVTVTTTAGDLPLTDAGSAWTGSDAGVSYSFVPSTGVLTVTGGLDAVTPGSTTASATAGNASVSLSWTAASDADTYVVRRSTTSGGPYVVAADGVAGLSYTDTLLTNGTTYYYTVQAKNSGSGLTGPVSTEVSATPEASVLTGIESWREQYFSSSENAGNGADLADPDGDGVVNLLEYATNSDPTVANAAPVVAIGKDGAGTHLTLTFTRIADETLVYSVQATNDLAGTPTWTEIENFTGSENVAGSVTVTDTELISASPRRFLRLSVSYPTP